MANTQSVLYGIRDHLGEGIPNADGALSLVKDVLRRGACQEETKDYHQGTLFLLEEILRPLLIGNRELEVVIHHSAQKIRQSGTLDGEALEQILMDIDVGLLEVEANLMFPAGEPDLDLALLKKALATRGYDQLPQPPEGGLTVPWQKVYDYLATVLEAQNQKNSTLDRENGRRKRFLQDFTQGLSSTSNRLDRAGDVIDQLSDSLKGEEEALHLDNVGEVIFREIEGVGERCVQVMENLETIDITTKELVKLFHQADGILLETQDSDLMDAVSGMPNRYGLMARINQARFEVHEGNEAHFSALFIGIVDLGRVRKKWGRERFSALIRWLGGKIRESGSYELFRTASEGLAIFLPNVEKGQAMEIAQLLKETVLDSVQVKEEVPKEFYFGMGVASYEPGMDEEAFLLLGSEKMRRSILDDGKPTG
jgi:GGDEF domain-containing protein